MAEHRLRQRARVKLALWDAFHGTGQPQPEAYPVDTTGTTLYGTRLEDVHRRDGLAGRHGEPRRLHEQRRTCRSISEAKQAEDYEKLVHLANCEPTLTDFHIFHEIDESDRTGFQSGVLRVDFSERDSALATPNSVNHAIKTDNGSCAGGVWQTLGSFLYSSSAVVPDYKTFPYQGAQPLAATTVSGGGKYVTLDAGEGFTYSIVFKNGSQSANASGAAPRTTATVKIPTGFGAGTATIVLKAEMNPARDEHGDAQARQRDGQLQAEAEAQAEKEEVAAGRVPPKGAEDSLDRGLTRPAAAADHPWAELDRRRAFP